MKRQLIILTLSLAVLCVPLLSFAKTPLYLFDDVELEKGNAHVSQELSFFRDAPAVKKFKEVRVNHRLSTGKSINIYDEIQINLFDGEVYEAYIDRYDEYIKGTVCISARLIDEDGFLLISSTKGLSYANIVIPAKDVEYAISYHPDTKIHYLMEIDSKERDYLEDGPSLVPPKPTSEELAEIKMISEIVQYGEARSESTTDIDIMILYTPAAGNYMSAHGGISNRISQEVGWAQTIMNNSQINIDLHLVYNIPVPYSEYGDIYVDLDRLRDPDDGFIDFIHTVRDIHDADLVCLFETVSSGPSGLAYRLNSTHGSPATAFSIVAVQAPITKYVFAHEIGHNMGVDHHLQQSDEPGPGLYSYSAGWRWSYHDDRKCSVMTYEAGKYFPDGLAHTVVPVYSNPDVYWMTGTGFFQRVMKTGDPISGDNARTINNIKSVIAAYR